jgi:hypothetical protein
MNDVHYLDVWRYHDETPLYNSYILIKKNVTILWFTRETEPIGDLHM